jgi:ribosome biogenesis GTPase / thiamine phosphate phosphatase
MDGTDVDPDLTALGWDEHAAAGWRAAGSPGRPGRVSRLDRGWSTVLYGPDRPVRVRNIGADVAVGDWVVVLAAGGGVELVLSLRSAFTRRASFDKMRAEAHTIAANIDFVCLVHSLVEPPNERRLERELVLAFDSGATPVVVLTKRDLVDDEAFVQRSVTAVADIAFGVGVHVVSGRAGTGIEQLAAYATGSRTIALLGASGVGKSTLVNAIAHREAQRVSDVRVGDQRGRHTTTAVELVALPDGDGWLIDTPGLRALSLWASGSGIERAFADVFDLADRCRFRDCKHEDEPGCAVQASIAAGTLDPRRLASMKRLVAEEAALEEEQTERLRATDRRGYRRPRPR